MNKNKYLFIILSFGMLLAESQDEISPTFSDFQISSERYLTDEKGNIMMYVNIWGHVNAPGHHLVYEGIDMATMLSMVGGPRSGANLKKVRIYREAPDSDGKLQYQLNLQKNKRILTQLNFPPKLQKHLIHKLNKVMQLKKKRSNFGHCLPKNKTGLSNSNFYRLD